MTLMKMPRLLLHLEGLALLIGAVVMYAHLRGAGWLFAAVLLTPDLAMLGYMVNVSVGSILYNAVHTTVLPTLLGLVALATGWQLGVLLALIWFAHIGVDRLAGYGLKYPTAFKDTHLQRS